VLSGIQLFVDTVMDKYAGSDLVHR
jgi:hypothetical protein